MPEPSIEKLLSPAEKNRRLKEKFGIFFRNLPADRMEACNTDIVRYSKYLENKYPDLKRYVLVHMLIGSTVREWMDETDLPGDDSVHTYINRLIERYSV